MITSGRASLVAAAAVLALGAAARVTAEPNGPAEKSLDRCQNALRTEGAKYVRNAHKAIATCLGKISTEVLKKNQASVAAAVRSCTAQFDRIGRTDGRSIADRFTGAVTAKCIGAPPNGHTVFDLLGLGSPGVAEPLAVSTRLSALCERYGGDGLIGSLEEWIDCMKAAQDCSVHGAIAAEFPRAIEWLGELAAAMSPSPARDAVVATEAAIDGASDDGLPDLVCASVCVDGSGAVGECPGPDGCPESMLGRRIDEVVDDLHAAIAAEDWEAVACNYRPDAFVIDDQGVLIGRTEIVEALMSLHGLFDASPAIVEANFFEDVARVLFSLDGGWIHIDDGVQTYRIRGGKILTQTTHGVIRFSGPPPE